MMLADSSTNKQRQQILKEVLHNRSGLSKVAVLAINYEDRKFSELPLSPDLPSLSTVIADMFTSSTPESMQLTNKNDFYKYLSIVSVANYKDLLRYYVLIMTTINNEYLNRN